MLWNCDVPNTNTNKYRQTERKSVQSFIRETMAFTLWSLFKAVLLCGNAFAVLNTKRVLQPCKVQQVLSCLQTCGGTTCILYHVHSSFLADGLAPETTIGGSFDGTEDGATTPIRQRLAGIIQAAHYAKCTFSIVVHVSCIYSTSET